jgi:hypothetical protein
MQEEIKMSDMVIGLHDIAREVEQTIGFGALSKDIRDCADRLSVLLKECGVCGAGYKTTECTECDTLPSMS